MSASKWLVVAAAVAIPSMVGCSKLKAATGPKSIKECKVYLEAAQKCLDDKSIPKIHKMGIRVTKKVFEKNWVNTVAAGHLSEAKQDCIKYKAEVDKECGASAKAAAPTKQ